MEMGENEGVNEASPAQTRAKVRRFEDLRAWQLARDFRKAVYEASASWPKAEQYGLVAQIRAAAVSITANIAEGFGRYHFLENIQLCRVARGSANEVLDHLHAACDAGYLCRVSFESLYQQGREVERALNGYIGFLQREPSMVRDGDDEADGAY